MKVLCVLGTRPEAIKLAPVIRELARREQRGELTARVCVTGQHRAMLDQVLSVFEIRVDHDLNLMAPDQSLTALTATALVAVEGVLRQERPNWLVVQGDTTTVLAASLAAFYAGVPVAHVEAGLRTNDPRRPFPEEMNRRVAGVLADLHFAPTETARRNLLREGVADERIRVTGNPVIDALRWACEQPPSDETLAALRRLNLVDDAEAPRKRPRTMLVTAHRRESFGPPLENLCAALRELTMHTPGRLRILFPVHRNPRVREPVYRLLDGAPGVTLCEPLDYFTFVQALRRCDLVLTDSGGLQEEASSLGKPLLIARDATERPEAVEAGAARVIGTDRSRIVEEVTRLLDQLDQAPGATQPGNSWNDRPWADSPFGDGRAAERIVAALLEEGSP